VDVVVGTETPSAPDAVVIQGWRPDAGPSWEAPADVAAALAGQDAGEATAALRDGRPHVFVRLPDPSAASAETGRIAGGRAVAAARSLGAGTVVWSDCDRYGPSELRGIVEGAELGAYAFDRYRSGDCPPTIDRLVLHACAQSSETIAGWTIPVAAQNAARDLQNRAPNDLDPQRLAEHARALADGLSLDIDVLDAGEIAALGMGALSAVGSGSAIGPRVIVLRYAGGPEGVAPWALVGKAVTFDSGGLSLKAPGEMVPMKYDMSGGAVALEALAAVARLRLPINAVAVVGATENMTGSAAYRPGDIVQTLAGLTVEINDTDSEGRLVLADCLAYAVTLGASTLIDIATLTGAIGRALGDRYAGLFANHDELAGHLRAAGEATGELLWRMPMHPDDAPLTRGIAADLANRHEDREAGGGAIFGAQFLKHFVGGRPWAHLDVAATSYDVARPYYNARGGTGFGVRLLVELLSGVAGRDAA
jgi:leucyl aminopeptidase